MEEIVLHATHRDVIGKQVKALRRAGSLPGILYGRQIDPIPVLFDLKETSQALSQVAGSRLIRIQVDGEQYPALVRERQRDNLRGSLIHVDFLVVSLTETVRAGVPLQYQGESPAVSEQDGLLVTGLDQVEVECLPNDLPDRIPVDLAQLKDVGDAIYVRDLQLPQEVKVLSDGDELIILVTRVAAEEIIEEEEVLVEEAEPELVERGKRPEELEEEGKEE